MDTDKLLKAIRILIKEEIKTNLPKLVKEVAKHEVAKQTKLMESKLRKSIKKELLKESKTKKKTVEHEVEEIDPFELASQRLQEDRQNGNQTNTNEVQNNSNGGKKSIQDILNETAKTYNPGDLNRNMQPQGNGVPINVSMTNHEAEPPVETENEEEMLNERTMKFDSSDVHKVGMNKGGDVSRAEMATKMGGGKPVPTETIEGKPVNPNDPKTDPVMKALNRDYTELVKRFKTK